MSFKFLIDRGYVVQPKSCVTGRVAATQACHKLPVIMRPTVLFFGPAGPETTAVVLATVATGYLTFPVAIQIVVHTCFCMP